MKQQKKEGNPGVADKDEKRGELWLRTESQDYIMEPFFACCEVFGHRGYSYS